MKIKSLNGLILAGGFSSRMGKDKSGLIYHDRPQVQYLTSLLAPYVDEVFISVREAQMDDIHLKGLSLIYDYYTSSSPVNGIASAMRKFPDASWLVIAIDMPFVNSSAIQVLIDRRDPQMAATCFESPVKSGPDPLFGIWESQIFSTLDNLLKKQKHICPRDVLKSLPVQLLRNSVSSETLININTPDDFLHCKKEHPNAY